MREIKIKGVYKHYKGDLYIVEDILYHSETCEKMVAYRALYGENKLSKILLSILGPSL